MKLEKSNFIETAKFFLSPPPFVLLSLVFIFIKPKLPSSQASCASSCARHQFISKQKRTKKGKLSIQSTFVCLSPSTQPLCEKAKNRQKLFHTFVPFLRFFSFFTVLHWYEEKKNCLC